MLGGYLSGLMSNQFTLGVAVHRWKVVFHMQEATDQELAQVLSSFKRALLSTNVASGHALCFPSFNKLANDPTTSTNSTVLSVVGDAGSQTFCTSGPGLYDTPSDSTATTESDAGV